MAPIVRLACLALLCFSAALAAAAPAKPKDLAESLGAEIAALGEAGKYDQALAKAEAALPRIRARYGAKSLQVAEALSLKAGALDDLGRYEQSWPLHDEAVALARFVGPGTLTCFEIERARLESLTNGGRAADAVERSLTLPPEVEAKLGPRHHETVSALIQQAYALDTVGRNAEALPVHERLMPLVREAFGAESRTMFEVMNNRGLNSFYLGRNDDALALFTQATAGLERLYGPEHPWVIAGRNNLAVVLQMLGKQREAAAIMAEAYAVDVKVLGETHPDTLLRLGNLGQLYAQMGETARAVEALEKAVAGYAPADRATDPNAIVARYNLAGAWADQGKVEEARREYHASLRDQIAVLGPRETYTLYMYSTIGRFERDHGAPAEALRLWDALVEATEAQRAEGNLAPEHRQAFFARWVQGYKESAALRAQQGDLEGALRLTELSKARTLLESSAVRAANELALPDAAARERVAALEAKVRELDARIAGEREVGARLALEAEKGAAVREYAAYRRELAERHPKYAALSDVRIVGRAEGGALLGKDARFIDLLVVDADTVLALVLDGSGTLRARTLEVGAGFADTVLAYRRLTSAPRGWRDLLTDGLRVYARKDGSFVVSEERPEEGAERVNEVAPIAARLGALLLEPLAPEIGRASRLIVAPDGVLATLPFKGKPLVATREVSYVQSLSMLALLAAREASPRPAGAGRLLAVGGAEYGIAAAPAAGAPAGAPADASAGAARRSAIEGELAEDPRRALEALRGTWAPLPGSAREVQRVAALFGERAALRMGAAASEPELRALDASGELAGFRYLLFSTHGYLSVRVPALSSVVLSQRDLPEGVDGYVTAVEWPGYRLDSDLLVLSACETGLGGTVQGEGVMGLPYALYVAGNRDTLLSLWSVVDASTEEFMVRFFARLDDGERPAQALARTKREFMKHREYAAPIHWAPFVLYGTN